MFSIRESDLSWQARALQNRFRNISLSRRPCCGTLLKRDCQLAATNLHIVVYERLNHGCTGYGLSAMSKKACYDARGFVKVTIECADQFGDK